MATIRFGVASRDITPTFPVMLHGYSSRDRLSEAVSEPIQASALCLQGRSATGDGRTRLVVVALDMIGVQAADVEKIRDELARECGIGRDELLIAASHTHFAPCISLEHLSSPRLGLTAPDPRYVALVRQAIREAVRESCADLESGELQVHRPDVPSVLFNRRTTLRASGAARKVETNFLYPADPSAYELSPVDPQLTALRIVSDGRPRAVLANFGCHPVTGGREGPESHYDISADYPFYVRKTVEQAWGCPVLFTLGAAGDAVPLQRAGSSREWIGSVLGCSILLGERVFTACRGDPGDAVLAHRVVRLEAATIIRTRGTAAEEEYRAARDLVNARGSESPPEEALRRYQAAALRAFRSRLYPEDRFTIEVAIHRIGDVILVAFPFEMLCEAALVLKLSHPGAVLVSVANGYQGYLPFAYEYDRGGYEASPESTHFEPGTLDRLLELVRKELDRI